MLPDDAGEHSETAASDEDDGSDDEGNPDEFPDHAQYEPKQDKGDDYCDAPDEESLEGHSSEGAGSISNDEIRHSSIIAGFGRNMPVP